MSQYQAAIKLQNELHQERTQKLTFKAAVQRVMHRNVAFADTVNIIKEYTIAKAWDRKVALVSAFIFGGFTGSSVGTILATLTCTFFAITPPGWAIGCVTGVGALWLGYNNLNVEEAKLDRLRNIALTRIFREKTMIMLEALEQSINRAASSPVKILKALDTDPIGCKTQLDNRIVSPLPTLLPSASCIQSLPLTHAVEHSICP